MTERPVTLREMLRRDFGELKRKLAGLWDNSNPSRVAQPTERDLARCKKCWRAIATVAGIAP